MSVPNHNLFAEFPSVSKAAWLAKIEKDLKGRPLSDLNWELNNQISVAPFLNAEDFAADPEPILDNRSANQWAVGEDILVDDAKVANIQTLAALTAGVNAPRFVFDKYPTEEQLSILLKDIELDFISTHFQENTDSSSPLSFLKNFATIAGEKAAQLNGAVHYDPFASGQHDVQAVSDVVNWTAENMPSFSAITVNAERFYQNTEGVVSELTNALSAGEGYLKLLSNNGLSVEKINSHIAFRFQIGNSYFLEIAKLRAFKLLWGNVLAAYNTTPSTPRLFVRTSPILDGESPNTHKIQATTQAMSAVVGGVEVLTVAPSENSAFGRRVARNVQHLLSMESYLDRVTDPSAGSYYIEKMTEQLAEAAWAAFQNLN